MSVLVNVMTFGPVNFQITGIIILIELSLNKTFVSGLQLCRNEVNEHFIVDREESVEVSFCFTDSTHEKNHTEVSIKHNGFRFPASHEKVTFNWTTKKNGTNNLHIYIFNITDSDLSEWTFYLYDKLKQRISYEKSFKLYSDEPSQFYFKKKSEQNERELEIFCSNSNFPKKLQIINRCENKILVEKTFNPKNYKRTLELTYYINDAQVSNPMLRLAYYECKVFDFENKSTSMFQDFEKDNEPAFICPFNEKEIKANVYDTVYIGFQVLAYPNITSVVVTKSANLNTKDTNWTVEIIELSRVFWYLELSKDILQENDFDNYTVWVTSNVNLSVSKNFTLFVKDNLLNNSSSTEDYCTNETSTVLYRIVKSGLPVLLSSNMSESYVTEILPNKLASEYLIKVYLRNCTQHIGKVETLTLQAGSKFVTISFNAKEKYFNLSSCAPTIQETTLMISIGENVELNMCVISNTLIKGENVGFNRIASSNFIIFKHSVEIKKENNQQIIILTIKNITRDDIKFYQVRIRDTLKGTVTFVFNLKLKEDAPSLCNSIRPTVESISNKTLHVSFCIRSYTILSRDIVVNKNLYKINASRNDVTVESRVDEKTFSNYLTLKIPTKNNIKTVNITVTSVKNTSFSFHLDVTNNNGIGTTLTTVSSITTTMSNSSTETPGILDVTTDKPEQAETSCTTIIIISVLAVVITILLIVVVVYFIYFKRKLVKRRNSPNLRLKYLNHPHYNNMEELKSLKVDKDQNLSNYETRYANIVKERNVDQVVPKDPRNTEMAQGRYRNDEGLIYITIDHSDLQSRSSKSYTSKASQPETESNYVTIDPFKTKHFK